MKICDHSTQESPSPESPEEENEFLGVESLAQLESPCFVLQLLRESECSLRPEMDTQQAEQVLAALQVRRCV